MSSIVALNTVAVAVAAVLDGSMELTLLTGHPAPHCERLGNDLSGVVPVVLFQTANARARGGLLGSYSVEVELYAIAATAPEASTLLATAYDALSPTAFAGVGLDAVPSALTAVSSDPLEKEELPYPETFGFATTLSLDVFISPD